MIFDIRGTHGSGKSTVAKHVIDEYGGRPIYGDHFTKIERPNPGNKPLAYQCSVNGEALFVLGAYSTQCGGCDGIPTQDEITARLKHYSGKGHVLLEGILVSHTFGRWNDYAAGVGPAYLFFMLDTPLDVCIRRVEERRRAKAEAKGKKAAPLDTKNIVKDWHRIKQVGEKLEAAGRNVRRLPHGNAPEAFDKYVFLTLGKKR